MILPKKTGRLCKYSPLNDKKQAKCHLDNRVNYTTFAPYFALILCLKYSYSL